MADSDSVEDLGGILPPMATPFTPTGEIDEGALRAQTRFLLDHGVPGLVVGGSTGEGHTLDADEARRVYEVVSDEVVDRVPVVAGVIVDSTREAVRRGRALAAAGARALQVTPVHYLFRPDDEAMLGHFRTVAEETGVPVIIYNVVPWSYLSPELLCRIMREVPGVVGVKQSAGDLKLFADLMIQARPQDLIYSAVDALLYPSFCLGAHGAVAATLAAAPGPCVELWDAVRRGEHERARLLHERLLPLWNAICSDNLPACVKLAQTLQGCPPSHPRAPMPEPSAAQREAIEGALRGLELGVRST